MATSNGNLYIWSSRNARLIGALAPNFHEIDENKEYIESEKEFDLEQSSSDDEQSI